VAGATSCIRRHIAKRKIISTFAVLCGAFVMQLLPHDGAVAGGCSQPDKSFFAVGAMSAKGKVPSRNRQQRLQQQTQGIHECVALNKLEYCIGLCNSCDSYETYFLIHFFVFFLRRDSFNY
jgi:hypothetical protein